MTATLATSPTSPTSLVDDPRIGAYAHWTTFPAATTGVDFTDHRAAHSFVMGIFPTNLDTRPEASAPGERSQGRSMADILFRVDVIGDQRHVLVQSRVAALHPPEHARSIAFAEDNWRMPHDALVRFRVAVNPIVRNGRTRSERVLDADASLAWLLDRLAPALSGVDIACHSRDTFNHRGHASSDGTGAPSRHAGDALTLDTFDGTGIVADPDALDSLRLTGIGRRKAYGAGLLTVQRIG